MDNRTIASCDIGYGYTKATDGQQTTVFPSVVGDVVEVNFDNEVMSAGSGHTLTLDGQSRFYGDRAQKQSRNPMTLFARERVEQADLMRALFAGAMVELGIKGRVKLCTGLPIDWYGDKETLERDLMGPYDLAIDGEPWPLHVCQAVIVPQPFGSFFDVALDADGKLINAGFVRSKVGILDVGTFTTDYALSEGLEYIAKGSGSTTAAMATVWRYVSDEIRRSWGIDYPLHKIDGFMRNGYTVMVEGHNLSILPMVEPALDALAQQVIAGARERWGKARDFARILLTGGGAEHIGDQVQAVYPHCQVLHSPHLGNLRGFQKYAIRKFGG